MKEEEKNELFSPEELAQEEISEDKLKEKGLTISESWLYKLFVKSAYRLIEKPLAILTVMKRAIARMKEYDSVKSFTVDAKNKLNTIIRLLTAYAKGEYRGVSKMNIALTLAAILYFLAPFDLIPDFLAIGLLDDLAILTWVYQNFQSEIDSFLDWEDKQKLKIDIYEDDNN